MFIFDNRLGESIRDKRKEMNYTLRDLAEKSGVSYSQLSKIERGESLPTPFTLTNIAYSLNIDKDILLGLGGYMSQDVYSELINPLIVNFTDEEYFRRMPKEYVVLLNLYENIEILIKDLYKFFYKNKRFFIKFESSDLRHQFFWSDLESKLSSLNLDEMISILEAELFIVSEANVTLDDFLSINKITYSKKNIDWSEFFENDFVDYHKNNNTIIQETNSEYYTNFVKLPIYGEIKAGYGMYGDENIIGFQMEASSRVSDGEYFYLLVKGDSMMDDGIIDGCRVLVRKQNTVPNGKIGVCIINGDEATLKRVVYDGDKIILMAANKNVLPKTYDISEVLIQGQVKSFVVDI